jgi:hypothetical protein
MNDGVWNYAEAFHFSVVELILKHKKTPLIKKASSIAKVRIRPTKPVTAWRGLSASDGGTVVVVPQE